MELHPSSRLSPLPPQSGACAKMSLSNMIQRDIGSDLIHQLSAYVRQEPPFRLRAYKKPMGYWMRLQKDEDSAILAVCPKLAISVNHLSGCLLRYLVSNSSPSFPHCR